MAKRRKRTGLGIAISGATANATDVARRVCEDIRGDILRLSRELNIASSARDRSKVEAAIKNRINKMRTMLEHQMDGALTAAAQEANAGAGLAVRYSPDYAREIIGMVQQQQGENLASVFSRKMSASIITALRKATVSTIQEAAVLGLSLQQQKNMLQEKWEESCKGLGRAVFVDSSGREWAARDYFTMNVRTNAMRVYNDVMAGNIANEGHDLVRITRHGDPHCRQCFPWEGRIVSITGKTSGYPTYAQAREFGCFHPNCTHQLVTVDEIIDEQDIEQQRGLEAPDSGRDPMKIAFDNDVKLAEKSGMSHDEAVLSVKRDRIRLALQTGIPDGEARKIADELMDDDIAKLTDGWHVPRFSEAKKHEPHGWNRGSSGGRIVLPRDNVTVEALLDILKRKKR